MPRSLKRKKHLRFDCFFALLGFVCIKATYKHELISPTCLCPAFIPADSSSVKIRSSCQYLFALLGSANIKAARKHVDEIETGSPTARRQGKRAPRTNVVENPSE